MKTIERLFHTSLCLLMLAGTAAADTGPGAFRGLSPRVEAGEIVASRARHPRTDVSWGKAVGIVDAPMERVLDVVQDYARYREFMPNFTQSRILSKRGNRAMVYVEAEIAKRTLTIWANMKMTPTETAGGGRTIHATMMKGNLSTMEALWELTPLQGGRTLVTFKIIVEPKLPLPDSLVSLENEKASKRGLRALRKQLTQRFASGS